MTAMQCQKTSEGEKAVELAFKKDERYHITIMGSKRLRQK